MQFPKELYDASEERLRQLFMQAAAINPNWTTVENVVENVRHSPALRDVLAGALSPRHPSQLYEAALEGVLLFAILWILRTHFRLPNGILTGAFFIGYAVLRMIGELFREPDAPLTGPLTRGQFLSLFLLAIGLGFFVSAWLRPEFPVRRQKD